MTAFFGANEISLIRVRKVAICLEVVSAALLLAACGPTDREKSELIEKHQAECLDRFCEGDVAPATNPSTETTLKLNGQWYIGPKPYFNSNSTIFYWPSKIPAFDHGGAHDSIRGRDFSDIAIQVLLGRDRALPVQRSLYQTLSQLKADGFALEEPATSDGIQVWKVSTGNSDPETWYVATLLKEPNGDPPTVACRGRNPKLASCTTGFVWRPGVGANMRFRGEHAPQWPAIYLETTRVLSLLRKA